MNDPIHQEVYWYTLKKPTITKLFSDMSADVVVVGGGMAGLTVAQRLVERGLSVVVLEKDFCGSGATGKSSGFITPDSELELSALVKKYGKDEAKDLWEFVSEGVEHIRKTIQKNSLDCDYKEEDSLFVARKEKDFTNAIRFEDEARRSLGYQSVLYSKKTITDVIGSSKHWGGVRYGSTFGINAYLYVQNLKEVLVSKGVKIFEESEVTKITNVGVEVGTFKVHAPSVILCIDRFSPDLKILKKEVYSAQTFLSISKPLRPEIVSKIFPQKPMMVWDTDLIYQYYRITNDRRLLLGASSILHTYTHGANGKAILSKMVRYMKNVFDIDLEIDYFWPGLIGVSQDFLPLAGRDTDYKNVYYIAGVAGLPWAAALGNAIADTVATNHGPTLEVFKKDRKYPVPRALSLCLPKPIRFAISHGIVKYFNK